MGLFSFLSSKSDPSKAALPYLNKISPMAEQRYNPYIQQGKEAGENAFSEYKNLTNNPTEFLNKLLAAYTPSKGFEFGRDEALKAMQGSAAAGGYAGTHEDQLRQGKLAQALSSQDMYEWLDRILGLHNRGLEGQNRFGEQGYRANESLTDIIGNALNQQGTLAFQGQAQRNQNNANLLNSLLGAGAAAAGAIW